MLHLTLECINIYISVTYNQYSILIHPKIKYTTITNIKIKIKYTIYYILILSASKKLKNIQGAVNQKD